MDFPKTDESVSAKLREMGFDLNRMSGIPGVFYTTDRLRDLLFLIQELLACT